MAAGVKVGPVTVRNTDDYERTWPNIPTTDGHTLRLKPGEEAVVQFVPLDDPFLEIVSAPAPAPVAPPPAAPPDAPDVPVIVVPPASTPDTSTPGGN